jgi:phosphohistidine swiveling domain-containing protein
VPSNALRVVVSRSESQDEKRRRGGAGVPAPASLSTADIALGTKAESLERLSSRLSTGTCLPQVYFTVERWQDDATGVIDGILSTFDVDTLVVRSSSLREDTAGGSNAGRFCSVTNVRRHAGEVRRAVCAVVASYGEADPGDQVLVQPQVRAVAASGVIFTRDLQCGAPYFVINVDFSGATTGITSGTAREHETHYVRRSTGPRHGSGFVEDLVALARELEGLTGVEPLDIEFAIDRAGTVYVLQVRPLVCPRCNDPAPAAAPVIDEARRISSRLGERVAGLAGRRTLLSDMSDWNPAELVGHHPKPLALSLFEALVTDEPWREGRMQLGYSDAAGTKLLVEVAGRPYVDVRNSFNSLLPACVPPAFRERIIDEAIDYLEANPDLHDKVEFEVATTCFTPSFDARWDRVHAAGLTPREYDHLKTLLIGHTETLVRGEFRSLGSLMTELAEMDAARAQLLSSSSNEPKLWVAQWLLNDCRRRGLTSFAAVARLAFVGNALLRSFVETGAITPNRAEAFLRSLTTVAGEMTEALAAVRAGSRTLEAFLRDYGHLRPGTFDITSPRYDEAPEAYFSAAATGPSSTAQVSTEVPFEWTHDEIAAMTGALQASGMGVGVGEVIDFARASLTAREKAKFVFTRNLSDALRLVTEWGARRGLAPENLAFLRLDQLWALDGLNERRTFDAALELVDAAVETHLREGQIILPDLITGPLDVDHARFATCHATFVTGDHVVAPTAYLASVEAGFEIDGRIVLVESADPGYDWILGHDIRGLVTKYGGAASHMAIRCAEFGLPAAIGVGSRFDTLCTAGSVELDCANQQVVAAT